jgi:hypothetical protein
MRTYVPATVLAGALLCGAAFAQSAPPSTQNPSAPPSQPQAQPATSSPEAQPQPPQPPQATQAPASAPTVGDRAQAAAKSRIAPGSIIPVQLTKTIDAKKAKTGDEVEAKVTMDLKTNSGEVIVPKDTKVIGHVTEAHARSKDQKESQVGIAFDRAVLKDGEMSLPMAIQAVIAPPTDNANNGGGYGQGAPATGGGAASPSMGGGRTGSAGQSQPSGTPNAVPMEGASAARPPITENTQGVVGISNLKLEPVQSAAQGSVLSSEKNNVKVESGTMMLLKVNQ